MLKCSVCSDNSLGCHYGVQTCRACCAFFRRAITRNHNYKCNENQNCEILFEMRNICKGCRFAKCISEGMNIDLVQTKRDLYGKRKLNLSLEVPSTSKTLVSIEHPIGKISSLLQNFEKNYGTVESIRLLKYQRGTIFNRTPRAVNYKEACGVFLTESYLVFDWILNSFPDFAKLPDDQQRALARNLNPQFNLLEGGFFMNRCKRSDIRFLASGDFIDCRQLETYYYDPDGHQEMSSAEAVQMFASSFQNYRQNVWSPMMAIGVDCFEFLALAGLVLWDIHLENISSKCLETCQKNREIIIRELLHYYRSTNRESDLRIGKLLEILPNLQRASRRFQDDVELSNVLNAYSVDPVFYDKYFSQFEK